MILQKGQVNDLIIYVTERTTLDVPYFLFHFLNQGTDQNYYCTLLNTSVNPEHYDEFSLTEGADVTLPAGTYLVKVYEQPDPDNLDPENVTSLVREDIWVVAGEEVETTAYNGASNTGAAYGG
jgi:hypothetical protein